MARIAALDRDGMSEAQRRVHDAIAQGPRGTVEGPLAVWLHRPELADKAQALGRYARYDSGLEPRLSELAILVTAKVWGAEFEWWAHREPALKAGVAPAIVEAIRQGQEPSFERDDEQLVYRFALTLHRKRRVGDDLYGEAVALLGEALVLDLVAVLGYYTLVSMTLNVFEVEVPSGGAPQLEPRELPEI